MSDNFLFVILVAPWHVPPGHAQQLTNHILRRYAPRLQVIAISTTTIGTFVDCSGNFEYVAYPSSSTDINRWWTSEIERVARRVFDLTITTLDN